MRNKVFNTPFENMLRVLLLINTVDTAYIAEVKRDLGLPMYDAPNAVEKLKQPRKHPTPEKVEAIKDALKHFEVI